MPEIIQFDPSLKELLLRKTGDSLGRLRAEEALPEEVPVIAKLADPERPVGGLRVVTRLGKVVTGRVAVDRVVEVRQNPNVISLKASLPYGPTLAYSVPEIRATAADLARAAGPAGVAGRNVVVGVIDWGCDFAHSNFRDRLGRTRLLYLWDQRGGSRRESPAPFGYGREFTREHIDAALAERDPYAALRYDPALGDTQGMGTHGTHVLDIAAGNGRAPGSSAGVAPEADLIFVHLRGEDTRPEDNLGDSVRVLEAVRYVADRAGTRPVVINMSLGRTGGPHDHTPLAVQGLDALLEERPGLAVVMSAGNYYEAGLHSSGRLSTGETADLRWVVTPRNDEIAEMEVWYPGEDTYVVELIDPRGQTVARVGLGEDRIVREGGEVVATLYHRRRDPNNGDNQCDLFLWPSALIGTWVTRLRAVEGRSGRPYNAWIERDDPAFQTRFAPECAVKTQTTNSICNGLKTIAVAAYDARIRHAPVVNFSSAGPTRDGRAVPVVSAPGAGIRAARSTRIRNGRRQADGLTVKSGTSMAAPHVTGIVALMFEAAGEVRLKATQTRAILQRTARKSPPFGDDERARYGAGRADAAAAVAAVLALTGKRRQAREAAEALAAAAPSAAASAAAEGAAAAAPDPACADASARPAVAPREEDETPERWDSAEGNADEEVEGRASDDETMAASDDETAAAVEDERAAAWDDESAAAGEDESATAGDDETAWGDDESASEDEESAWEDDGRDDWPEVEAGDEESEPVASSQPVTVGSHGDDGRAAARGLSWADWDDARLRGRLARVLPRLLVEVGDSELRRLDARGVPVYDMRRPLHFRPSGRSYYASAGRLNYHAANFVYNTAYLIGYEVPVYPPDAAAAVEGRSYLNTNATFEALALRDGGLLGPYLQRFFRVVARPGERLSEPLRPGDLLLRAAGAGRPLGHIAVVVDPQPRPLDEEFFVGHDSDGGLGLWCISAGGTLRTLDDHFGRALAAHDGTTLDTRLVARFSPSAIDLPRVLLRADEDAEFRHMLAQALASDDGARPDADETSSVPGGEQSPGVEAGTGEMTTRP